MTDGVLIILSVVMTSNPVTDGLTQSEKPQTALERLRELGVK